jgi:hypothetical protein
MSKTFNGILMISLQISISPTTLSAVANATTSSVTANVSGGRGVYTYLWVSSGIGCTITSPTAAVTTFTGSSVAGNTSIYCAVTDTITGNTLNTDTCTITWTAVPISQSVVISGGPVTYNGAARAYTLTGTPDSPAPTGNPPQFINAGTYVYPTNITSITPGSGYTLGSVTGSFVINRATISGTTANPTLTFNGSQQSAVVITNVSPAGATYSGSLTASGTNAGSYTSSITGTGNYTGTINGGTLTISRLSISAMSFTLNGASFTTAQSRTAGTTYTIAVSSVTPSGATYSPTSLSASTAGTYSLSSSGTGNYTGTRTSPVLTITAAVSGSINETNRFTPWSVQLTATLTGATAIGYAWLKIGGTWGGNPIISPSGGNPVTATVPSTAGMNNSIVQCTINYNGGSIIRSITIPWGVILH